MTTPRPPSPLGMSDFFALEAGEYLERLDALLQKAASASQAGDEFVRLARALRGSALMAGQQPIARAVSGLESLARALREGRKPWDAATKQVAVRAVDDLKIFVRRAASWTDADTAKAEALGQELDRLAGRPSAQVRAVEALGLDAGARAFVAREGAAIASALDRAAHALRANPLAHDPLQHVVRSLQPLRGVAALNELPPLADLLEGIERAIAELSASTTPPAADVGELFQAAAVAIARAARDVAERGRPEPEGAEFRQFAGRLVAFLERDPDVRPISALYYDDAGPHIVQRGTPLARPATLGQLELVSHGEHLRQAADSLERAPSGTQRELRAHTLAGTFRALANASGGPLAERVAHFAAAARHAVTSGVATHQAATFAAELRRAGDVLAQSSGGDETALAARLAEITTALEALAKPAAAEAGSLGSSWLRYEQLAATGVGPASLEELLAGPRASSPPPSPPPRAAAPPPALEPQVVDIHALLYRGERAAQRAAELREEAQHASGDALRAIVEELRDLVVLASRPGPAGA